MNGWKSWIGGTDPSWMQRAQARPLKLEVGAPAKSCPPCGAPSWSVDSSWTVTQPSDRKFDYRFNSS